MGLAKFYSKVATRAFTGIGSLRLDQDENLFVGPLLTQYDWTRTLRGPFTSNRDCWTARIDHKLNQIKSADYAAPQDPAAGNPLTRFLALLEFRNLIQNCEEMGRTNAATYIMQGDNIKADVVFVQDGHVTCVNEWEL